MQGVVQNSFATGIASVELALGSTVSEALRERAQRPAGPTVAAETMCTAAEYCQTSSARVAAANNCAAYLQSGRATEQKHGGLHGISRTR